MRIGFNRNNKDDNKGHTPALTDRPVMALRWCLDTTGTLRRGWPQPGTEADCPAYGWVPFGPGFGVIENSLEPVGPNLLDQLERAFPGRRWVEEKPAAGRIGPDDKLSRAA
ncbi:MAG: hypothetical protein AAGI17_06065 [Planctomycetota bacterium]